MQRIQKKGQEGKSHSAGQEKSQEGPTPKYQQWLSLHHENKSDLSLLFTFPSFLNVLQ